MERIRWEEQAQCSSHDVTSPTKDPPIYEAWAHACSPHLSLFCLLWIGATGIWCVQWKTFQWEFQRPWGWGLWLCPGLGSVVILWFRKTPPTLILASSLPLPRGWRRDQLQKVPPLWPICSLNFHLAALVGSYFCCSCYALGSSA